MKNLFKVVPIAICLATASCGFASFSIDKDTSTNTVQVTGVSLNHSSYNLQVGRTLQLSETVSPKNASNKAVTWSSSDTSVVSVSNGKVTVSSSASIGDEASITVKTKDGGYTADCKITIEEYHNDEWTILVYMCGSNLESDFANLTVYTDPETGQKYSWNGMGLATMDIKEIIDTPNKPDDVNIVIETGGSNTWTNKVYGQYGDYTIDSSKLQIHHVENNKIKLDMSLNYSSMGKSETLEHFISYGLENYPADKTALILWNHGGGLQGVCFDEKSGEDGLTGPEVITAVKNAVNGSSLDKKLEWIGYDACLMDFQDNAIMNSEYFNYMVASQESESGYGWEYSSWVKELYAKKSTPEILQTIVDGFIADNGGTTNTEYNQTLAYLDLTYADEYKDAWESMAKALANKFTSSNKYSFKSILDKCKAFGESAYQYYGLFDVKSFINRLAANPTFNPGSAFLNNVLDAFNKFVAYSSKNEGAGEANGLSLYWAYNGNTSYFNPYSSEYTPLTNWRNLVSTYGG